MAIQVVSGASNTILTVDPVSDAARVSLYDPSGNSMSDISLLNQVLNALNAASTITLAGQETVSFSVEGTTGTLTLSFEYTTDNINWYALSATPVSGGITVTSTSTNGQWVASIAGFLGVRARISAFTSGSMTVSLTASPGTSKFIAQAVAVSGTIPISGTVTSNQGTPAVIGNSWPVEVTDGTNVLGVTAHPLRIDPTGTTTQPVSGTVTANQGGSWTVTANAGTNLNTSALALDATVAKLTISQGTALGSNTQAMVGGSVTTSAPTYTTGQISPLSLTTAGGLRVDGSAVTQPISAASLPLPSGASTAANQTTLGNQTTKINDGTNTAAVKASSTQATITDPALVVALSPNNTPFAFGGDDRLRVGQETWLFYDNIEGTTIDLNRWVQSQQTMTQTQVSGSLTLNSGSDTTSGDFSILKSAKQILVPVEFPIYVQFRARLIPQTNAVIELGFGFVTTTSAPTDGVFFRVDASGNLKGVINNNGVETLTSTLGSLTPTTYYNFEATIFEDKATFEVTSADGSIDIDVSLPIPAGQGATTSVGHLPVFARVYNSGTPSSAAQIIIASVSAQQMDLATNKSWGEQMAAINRSAIYDPATFAQTPNYTNNTIPAAATLSNTAAGYTTLGGLFRFATPAGAETDYALFAYQVPAQSLLYIYSITVSTYVTGANSSGSTPILLQWAIGVNSSAVSLATGAPNPPIFQTIGLQQVSRTAAIGDAFTPGELTYTPNTPLIVNPSRFFHIVLRIPLASALATQFIRGSVTVEGIFE